MTDRKKNNYLTLFGALSANYEVNDAIDLTATASSYNTQEEEYFDIAAAYNLGEVDANVGSEDFGEVEFSEGIGSQLNHARNDLDALISNFQLKGTYKKESLEISAGLKYQHEDIKDPYPRMGNHRFIRFFGASTVDRRKQPTLCFF